MSLLPVLSLGGGLLLLPFLVSTPTDNPGDPPKANKYIGANKCKSCHKGAATGDMYAKWEAGPHAKAFKTLASKEAKAFAKELKIADPQKSEKCLSCHTTAFGVDKKQIKRGFKPELGVQCESCHGPGDNHQKIRMKEAMSGGDPSPVADDEIVRLRDAKTCKGCHNEKSPTYKPFCFKERMKTIAHFDPRKKRTEEEIKKIEAKCTPDCEVCGEKKKDGDKKDGDKKDGDKKDG